MKKILGFRSMASPRGGAGADGEGGTHAQLARLKLDLEQERGAVKQLRYERARELKAAREKEQASAREQLESLKLKLQKEKNHELQVLRDALTKDFKAQLKAVQKRRDDESSSSQKESRRREMELRTKIKTELESQIEEELKSAFDRERKKLTQELFQVESQRREAEERSCNLEDAERSRSSALRELDAQHKAELEQLQRSARFAGKKQLEELEALKRQLRDKDRELAMQTERVGRGESQTERLEEDLRRMKHAESWSRRSSSATPPRTLSPSNSTDELVVVARQTHTKRERELVEKNSDLSFRLQAADRGRLAVEQTSRELEEKLKESQAASKPTREHNNKLTHRVNELNAAVRSREKQIRILSDENLALKEAKQGLEEEFSRQRRSLKQQLSQGSVYRNERQKLMVRNRELEQANQTLSSLVEELQDALRSSLTSPPPHPPHPPHSPLHSSGHFRSPMSPVDELGSQLSVWSDEDRASLSAAQETADQLEFEKEELIGKYDEIKQEYKELRGRHKALRDRYEALQSKARTQLSYSKGLELVKKEKLSLEREVSLIRSQACGGGRESPYDLERQVVVLEQSQRDLQDATDRVWELEDFIITQDEVHEFERHELTADISELKQLLYGEGGEGGEDVVDRGGDNVFGDPGEGGDASEDGEGVSALEEALATIKVLEEEREELVAKATPPEPAEEEQPAVTSVRLGQWVEQHRQNLEDKEHQVLVLQGSLEESVRRVASLLQLVAELEGRLASHEGGVVQPLLLEREREIQQLSAQLSQARSKLTRSRRVVAVGVNQQMALQLGHRVTAALDSVKAAVASGDGSFLLRELEAAEKAVSELLHSVFPGGLGEGSPPSPPSPPHTPTQQVSISPLIHPEATPTPEVGVALDSPVFESVDAVLQEATPTLEYYVPIATTSTTALPPSPPSPPPHPHTLTPEDTQFTEHTLETNSPPPPPSLQTDYNTQHSSTAQALSEEQQAGVSMETVPGEEQTIVSATSAERLPGGNAVSPSASSVEVAPVEQRDATALEQPVTAEVLQGESEQSSANTAAVKEELDAQASVSLPSTTAVVSSEQLTPDRHTETSGHTTTMELDSDWSDSELSSLEQPGNLADLSEAEDSLQLGDSSVQLDSQTSSQFPANERYLVATPTLHNSSVQAAPTTQSNGVQATPTFNVSWVQATPTMYSSGVQTTPPALTSRDSLGGKGEGHPELPAYEALLKHSSKVSQTKHSPLTNPTPSTGQTLSAGSKTSGSLDNSADDLRLFVAVMDYDPASLCTTGRPDLELPLQTGAVVAVRGRLDGLAYYTASFSGRSGRVPANFIQELDVQDPSTRHRLFNQTLTRSSILLPSTPPSSTSLPTVTPSSLHTPPRITSLPTITSSTTIVDTTDSILTTPTSGSQAPPTSGAPAPPTSLCVEQRLSSSALLVGWAPPVMDANGVSNRHHVSGYQLYANDVAKTTISGRNQTKALITGVTLSQPLVLGVATTSMEGRSSEVVAIDYQDPAPPTPHSPEPYRMYVALYDYDPVKCSPNEHPEFELSFKEGALLKVYGGEMEDGFLAGELDGRSGLVPASFMTELPADSAGRRSREASPVLPGTSKRLCARFDYRPDRDSPNPNPELELSFNSNDVITVYGDMHSDGFYSGELKGKFGLVPSNYLTPATPTNQQTTPTKDETTPKTKVFSEHEIEIIERAREQLMSSQRLTSSVRSHSGTGNYGNALTNQSKKKSKGGLPFAKDWVKSLSPRKRTGSAQI